MDRCGIPITFAKLRTVTASTFLKLTRERLAILLTLVLFACLIAVCIIRQMSVTSIWKHNLAKRINAAENFEVNLPRPELKRMRWDDARRGPAGEHARARARARPPGRFRTSLRPKAGGAVSGLSLGVTAARTSQRGGWHSSHTRALSAEPGHGRVRASSVAPSSVTLSTGQAATTPTVRKSGERRPAQASQNQWSEHVFTNITSLKTSHNHGLKSMPWAVQSSWE